MNMAGLLHFAMVFIFIGVFFNVLARPASFLQLFTGTMSGLVDTTRGLAGIR